MIKYLLLFVYLLFFIVNTTWAQKQKVSEMGFDSLYLYTTTKLSSENNDSAFIVATTMLSSADNPLRKVRVLMLLATLYERKGDAISAINYAHQAYDLAKQIDNKDWLLRINGFMSTTYRKVDLIKYGKKYLNEAIALSAELKLPLFQSFILQEKALYSINEKDYQQALDDLKESIVILENNNQNANLNSFFWATIAQLKGLCYYKLDKLDESKEQFQAALDSIDIETELTGFCFAGLANISLKQGKLDETAAFMKSAEKYSESSKNFELQTIMSQLSIDYYTIKGDASKVMKSQNDLILIKERQKTYTQEVVNNLIDVADEDVASTKSQSKKYILIIFGGAMLILLLIYFINSYKIRKQKNIYDLIILRMLKDSKFLIHELKLDPLKLNPSIIANDGDVLSDYDEIDINSVDEPNKSDNTSQSIDNEDVATKDEAVKDWKKNIISEDYKKLLEEKLNEFEENKSFLKPNLTLTAVASELNTNTKYLSIYISQFKDPHFNDYINRLRISYIIQKLHAYPEYKEYKISYLAEECGFSSHAKFATVFKDILGISPSTFIRNLKK